MSSFDEVTEVLVVGSGAAGMVTALAANESGCKPVIAASAS
jgi:succinate dehydrogenase/fumarate reductase flavoprotein subunit